MKGLQEEFFGVTAVLHAVCGVDCANLAFVTSHRTICQKCDFLYM